MPDDHEVEAVVSAVVAERYRRLLTDGTGQCVPERLRTTFEGRERIRDAEAQIRGALDELIQWAELEWGSALDQEILKGIMDGTTRYIRKKTPHAPCPCPTGETPCPLCKGKTWMTAEEFYAQTHVPQST